MNRTKKRRGLLNMLLGTMVSLPMIFGSVPGTTPKAEAADTVFNQKGSGVLGWHATSYSSGFTEAHMKSNIDWIADNFKEFGYEYIAVDGWVADSTIHNADGYITTYKNNWVHDWKYWADYVHSKGLKLGMYYNPSWIHQSIADDPDNKIVGTNIPIKDIVDPRYMHQTRYMIDSSKPGAEQYVKGMIEYYKSVGVDLLKIDFLRYYDDSYGPEATTTLYRWMREAAGDDMILYYANAKNRNHAEDEVKYADIIRASEDWRTDANTPGVWYHTSVRNRGQVKDNSWPPAYNIFDGFVWLSDVSGAGKVVIDGDYSVLSSAGSTDAEKKFRISLLAMAGSSINIGDRYNNIGNNDVYYKNWEILDMNKRGFVGNPLSRTVTNPLSQIWKGQLPDGTWVVSLFNREDTPQMRSVDFAKDLGLSGNYLVSDMWSHSALGTMSSYSENIEPHGVRMLKISQLTMEPYGAFFRGSQQVTLNALDPQAEIRYTTDGSEPDDQSPLYAGPFTIDKSLTVRAKITQGSGQGSEATAMFISSETDPIVGIAAGVTSLSAPAAGATQLLMPSVPSGYTVSIKSSSHPNVIQTDGTIIPPESYTTVRLVLEVKRTSDGITRDTPEVSVIVPGIGTGTETFYLFEGESLPYTLNPSNLGTKKNNETAASGGTNLQINFTATSGQWADFTANVPKAGSYEVIFGYKKNNARGIFQTYVDGTALGDPIDQYIETSQAGYFSNSLGHVDFTEAGNHIFRFEVIGKNPLNTKTTDFIIDYIKLVPAEENPGENNDPVSVQFSGDQAVMAGDTFELTYGLTNVKESVYAQDLTFTFDPAKVEFVEAESMKNGFEIVGLKQAPGQLRMIAVGIGDDASRSGGDLLKLTWKSKPATESSASTISLTNASMAIGDGTEKQIEGVSHAVMIHVITGIPGDLNEDGKVSIGDLAIVASHYGKSSADPDWDLYKFADLNHDGKIDIEDLAVVARKLLETP
jgi:archaellum component FlaG (FlaF/FlaG flagellin family)